MGKHLLFLLIVVVLVSGCVSYGSRPPAQQPPANQPPVTQPPVTQPPVNQSPAPQPSAPQPPPVQQPPVTAAVTIQNFAFSPATLTIKSGTTVTWTNMDSAPHTVTSDSGAFSSPQLSNGGSFSFTFNTAGTYSYHCSNHPYMKGTITVQ